MTFALVCVAMIGALGVIALIANWFDKGEDVIKQAHDCATCTAADEGECKIHCLIQEKKREVAEREKSVRMGKIRSFLEKYWKFDKD